MGKLTDGDTNTSGAWFRTKDLKDAPVKLRILSEPTVGYENWTAEGKPLRADSLAELLATGADWRVEKGAESKPRFFAAFFVWNHAAKCVQVAQFTQKTIRQQLEALENNEDWGDLTSFDITLSRADAGDKVSYTVQPSPAKPLSKEAQAEWARVKEECVGLAALFTGGNPLDVFGN